MFSKQIPRVVFINLSTIMTLGYLSALDLHHDVLPHNQDSVSTIKHATYHGHTSKYLLHMSSHRQMKCIVCIMGGKKGILSL